jgi:hypothetical protein
VRDARVELVEGSPVVEVGRVHEVPGRAQLVGERQEARRLAQRVMEKENLGQRRRQYGR